MQQKHQSIIYMFSHFDDFERETTWSCCPVATPSCYGHVDEPLWGAPFPWCQPLPGPFVVRYRVAIWFSSIFGADGRFSNFWRSLVFKLEKSNFCFSNFSIFSSKCSFASVLKVVVFFSGNPQPDCQGPLVPWPSTRSLKEMPEARYIWKAMVCYLLQSQLWSLVEEHWRTQIDSIDPIYDPKRRFWKALIQIRERTGVRTAKTARIAKVSSWRKLVLYLLPYTWRPIPSCYDQPSSSFFTVDWSVMPSVLISNSNSQEIFATNIYIYVYLLFVI